MERMVLTVLMVPKANKDLREKLPLEPLENLEIRDPKAR